MRDRVSLFWWLDECVCIVQEGAGSYYVLGLSFAFFADGTCGPVLKEISQFSLASFGVVRLFFGLTSWHVRFVAAWGTTLPASPIVSVFLASDQANK